ncbi:MAG: glycosyltransferase [Clostridia bacterium]|nr:glycosyltransferase [Clostridia bacterium]
MNILLVTMSMQIGGAETHVLELAKGLKRLGYTVYVMSNGGDYVQELEANQIEHIKAPMHNRKIGNMLKSYRILKQTIKEKQISVVHAHARIPAMIAGYACKVTRTPFVTTAHGVYKVNPVLKLLTSWGERTIAVSEDVKEYVIKEYGIKEENVSVTVNGIDMNKFQKGTDYARLEAEFSQEKEKKKIVHVSRLDKETSMVAHSLISLAENLEGIQVVIAGGGNEFDALNAEAQEVNAKLGAQRVIMAGPRTDINQFAALADIFVGVSRAALEAMASEKPVILAGNQGYLGIFDESILDKALETNFCCRGFELPSSEKIERDLKKLLNGSEQSLAEMGKYNRETVKKYYSLERMIGDAVKMYESV